MRGVLLPGLVLLAACGQQQGGEPVIRQDISGEVVRDITGKADPTPAASASPAFASACTPHFFEQVLLTDCVADPQKHEIATALAPAGGAPYGSFATYRSAVDGANVVFAVNGGMFDTEGRPVGYYVENGERLKELNRADGPGNFHTKPNGVFFGSNGKWQVLATDAFYSSVKDRPRFGTQSGPMLVIDGKLHPQIQDDGPSKEIRNGVGVDDRGRAHFVISEAPVSFGVLARFYRDELKIGNALYLDGNISALWDPAKQRVDGGAPIGPLIVVTKKQTAPADKPAP